MWWLFKNNSLISDEFLIKMCGTYCFGAVVLTAIVGFNILSKPLNKKQSIEKQVNPVDAYIDKYVQKFESSYLDDTFNQNIENVFYDKEQYNAAVKIDGNLLEKTWKQRILMESTPFGNVVMYYDAYRLSFVYYNDVNIPYSILNAIAMKYVVTYFCRDFFLDTSRIPSDKSTPFLHVHEIDKKDYVKPKIDVNKGPFAKFKNYSKEKSNDEKKDEKKDELKSVPKKLVKNKFISLGKLYNFSILRKIPLTTISKKKTEIPMDYKSFKQWHEPKQFKMVTFKDYESVDN